VDTTDSVQGLRRAVHVLEQPARLVRQRPLQGGQAPRAHLSKARNITLNWKACEALTRYLQKRPDVPYQEIFITKFQKPIGPRSIENVVSKYLAEAGIASATVHTIRHTFATSHIRNKTSLKVIQAALGHANLATTSRYVGLVAEEMNKQLQEHAL
jgi:integrase/recombinase XerD